MIDYYILVGQTPVPEPDVLVWAESFEISDRRVALTRVLDLATVSTVFLGLDHNFSRHGEPLLFETMVFWDDERGGHEQDRCSTWREAEKMHAHIARETAAPRSYFDYLLRLARKNLSQTWGELKEAIRSV